ncbi:MAG: glucokinase [Roseitalea porphyridii]|jgi:glucokinase|uniref:glucokinase n=1 Tax=Roseitalea porphyridii TaxID=1852022 RepID=UPI0032EAD7B7
MPSSTSPFVLPFPILIADIGGTNARFSILVDANAEPKAFATIRTRDFESLDAAIQNHVLDHTSLMPRSAVLAVAGPTDGDAIDLTNNDWVVYPRRMIADLGFDEVVVLNDYEAQALAVVALEDDQLRQIGGGERDPAAHRVVIGPGTGLGVAGLVHAASTWIPVAGEGGHVDLGPQTERDGEVFAHLERIGGRVSGEQVLCGRGMVNLYRAVAQANGNAPRFDDPSDVTHAAETGSDEDAVETLDLFAEYLGRVAGDLALVFMARGGVYLTGGITQKILPFFNQTRFRAAFDNKAPHEALVGEMPVFAILHDRAPMEGLAAYARTPSRFGVALESRHWTR